MNVPDFFQLAQNVFNGSPEKVARLRQLCDETDALRAHMGPDYPGVTAGEHAVNEIKGEFTRRIAYACHRLDARFGLRRKTTGQIATRPRDGVTHSTDALMLREEGQLMCQVVDCMSDRDVTWGVTPGDTQPVGEWLEPLPEVGDAPTTIPLPGPIVVTTPAAADDIRDQQINALATHLAGVVDVLNMQGAALTDYQLRLQKLEDKANAPGGELPALEAVGSVKLFGHNYEVRLPVKKA